MATPHHLLLCYVTSRRGQDHTQHCYDVIRFRLELAPRCLTKCYNAPNRTKCQFLLNVAFYSIEQKKVANCKLSLRTKRAHF